MNLIDNDISELEDILVELLIGKCDINISFDIRDEGRRKYIDHFVSWMFKKKEIIEDLNRNIMEQYQKNKVSEWIPFYKLKLVQEIRDIKIKNII